MAERDDESFRPRVAPPRAKRPDRNLRFVSRVLRSASKAGPVVARSLSPTRKAGAKLGRGHAAAAFAGRGLDASSRRVVIKTRLVVLKAAGPRSTAAHLRYIERDGVTKDGQSGQAYDALRDRADPAAFEARGRDDRHQFRIIVAPEDSEALGDLHRFTRDWMSRMEADLGTRLDWVAVDHWDTGHPHIHVVLRGVDEQGRSLVIARDYLTHGMRFRASELATEWLGPRTQQEIQDGLLREVEQERWTSLDRTLLQLVVDGAIARDPLAAHEDRSILIGRLRRLSIMGLVDEVSPGSWHLRPDVELTLRQMGERGDIIRKMQRALGEERREFAIGEPNRESVVGRVVSKGLADELTDRGYLVVDGIDGRAHYVPLPASVDLADVPVGSVVDVRADRAGRPMDRTIATAVRDGVYSTRVHRELLASNAAPRPDPETAIAAAVRRLEALRRAGIVERLSDGVWRIPEDFAQRVANHDRQRLGDVSVALRSTLPTERQVRAIGATWLDQQLVGDKATLAGSGFGADVHLALAQRRSFLIEQGLAERNEGRFVPVRNLLATLRTRELEATAKAVEAELGLVHRRIVDGRRVSGVYRRSVFLASGRFALLDDGVGFSLVPWRPVIERRLGQSVTGLVRSGDVSWDFSRQRGLGIG